MAVVREVDRELRAPRSLGRFGKCFRRILELEALARAGRDDRVTDRADRRARAAEELLSVAFKTGGVLRVVCDVGESFVFRARLLPVVARNRVTGVAALLMLWDVVREFRVVAGRRLLLRGRRRRACGSASLSQRR